MASIHDREVERPDGSVYRVWVVRWRDGGRNRQQTCKVRKSAERLKVAIEAAHDVGQPYRPQRRDLVPELNAVWKAFLADAKRTLKETTIAHRRNALTMFLRFLRAKVQPGRGPLRPELLTRDNLSEFWAWLRSGESNEARKRGCRNATTALTANHYVGIVQRAWAWAYDSEDLGGYIPRPRALDMRTEAPVMKQVAPTWAEIDQAIAAVPPSPDWYRRLMIVIRFTGLRRGQAMRLEWADLDTAARLLTIRPELGKSRQEQRGRVVPVSPHLIAEAAGWGKREGSLVKPDGGYPQVDTLHAIWERTPVPREKWRQPLHCGRKAFKSELRRLGVAVDTLDFLTGHDRGVNRHYISDEALMAEARAAVALIPAVGQAAGGDMLAARRDAAGGDS